MFSFFLCSQHVHFKFPISSHQVPTYGKMEYLPLWPTYIRENGEDFGQKHKALKRGAIGNTLGEHIESLGKPFIVSTFFVMSQSSGLIAKKKESWTCEVPSTN
jgi:hypothetical protein